MPFVRPTKEEGLRRVTELVARYRPLAAALTASDSIFTEAEARVGYVDPLLEALGWDLRNEYGHPQRLIEVVMERVGADASGVTWGRPDYRLRLGGEDVMPVEAKRPAVSVGQDSAAAVQARSYGWSLSLPAAVLTNFNELIVFDSRVAPSQGDAADVAVIPGGRFHFEEYITRFNDLWRLLSFESLVYPGLEAVYGYERPPRGQSPFDQRFLSEFRAWRQLLAQDIAAENPSLAAAEIGRRTQRLLNALLFLRVCEDRNISSYKELLESVNQRRIVAAFREADRAFNAGLFTVLNETTVSHNALIRVISEMYWPRTQFAFGVLEPAILSGVYEQYLAERVVLDNQRSVTLEEKPEVTQAGGVVSTPDYIVRELGSSTIDPLLIGGVPDDLSVLDLATGSGIFLLDAFERIVARTQADGTEVGIAERGALAKKHLFGVDIDGAAVEVTKLSLLLAVLGDAHPGPGTLQSILPDLSRNVVTGNSVVREDFDTIRPQVAQVAFRRSRASPLNLRAAIGAAYPSGGFSAIVGNPPYVRIQVMSEHLAEQLEYLQDSRSGYKSPLANSFDLYHVFIERALELLASGGRLGYVVPHRFTNLLSASAVRNGLGKRIERLVHFGEEQVFPGRTTYVALIIAGPASSEPVVLELVDDLPAWREHRTAETRTIDRAELGAGVWPIATAEQSALFYQLESGSIAKLGDAGWVQIFVGVQTSADDYYFIRPTAESATSDVVEFIDHTGVASRIERTLLRPAIRDQKIDFYDGQPVPDFQAIFPYDSGDNPARPKVIDFATMRDCFPNAFAYFERHRNKLQNDRAVTPDPGDAYWAYGRSQSLGKLDDPKLIARVLSLSPQYALDTEGLLVPGGGDGGPYYLLRPQPQCPYSVDVIQAILSHPAVDLFVAVNGKKYRGSYASHRKAFLATVPVPLLAEADRAIVEANVRELRQIAVALRSEQDTEIARTLRERRAHLVGQVESILSAAYGLDIDLVARTTGTA